MPECPRCSSTLGGSVSCVHGRYVARGARLLEAVAYGGGFGDRCPHCGVTVRGYHHERCPVEICPACLSPRRSCTRRAGCDARWEPVR
jgi:hypothetical protein